MLSLTELNYNNDPRAEAPVVGERAAADDICAGNSRRPLCSIISPITVVS
jgi:hypothetical protein